MPTNNLFGNDIHVGIGDIKMSEGKEVLKAILGSCVGIGFRVPSLGIYALAHCFLPYPIDQRSDDKKARFVVNAVPALFDLLELSLTDAHLIEAIVAGGSLMHAQTLNPKQRIGQLNSDTALETLAKYKVKIIHQDLGGDVGRQLIINAIDGTYHIRMLEKG